MKKQHLVRELLRANAEGMTVAQLVEHADTDIVHMRRILARMPDAYIDRWKKTYRAWTAIWCVVVPPENCPRPDTKPKSRPRKEPR